MDYDELSNKDKILLEAEKGALKVTDVAVLLGISDSFAANLLRELWGNKLMSRKSIRKKKGGKKYSYKLMHNGEQIVKWLHSKGY
jgi:predicted transcriptional regulator